jgi:hypothetical protein
MDVRRSDQCPDDTSGFVAPQDLADAGPTGAHVSAPTPEFLDPLFFILGATLQGDRVMTLFEGFHAGALSLRTCLLVGRRKDDLRLPDELSLDGVA